MSLHLFSTGASWPVMNHTLFEPFTMSVSKEVSSRTSDLDLMIRPQCGLTSVDT